jgi:hypothetical protein
MYESLVIKHTKKPMSPEEAKSCVEWMREFVSPTLDHLTPKEFEVSVALFAARHLQP